MKITFYSKQNNKDETFVDRFVTTDGKESHFSGLTL